MAIPDTVVDEILRRSNIIEVINSMVPLTKASGSDWKACCPFHQEKTPSFHVSETKQMYYCFGCQKGGNVITFLKEFQNLDYVGALKYLADRYHVIIPEEVRRTPEEIARAKARKSAVERMYDLHREMAKFYVRELHSHPDSPVAAYFRTRGIDSVTADAFQIGAAPDSWDASLKYAKALGFSEAEIVDAGIALKNESGRFYDRFRNRLVFTITDDSGRPVGFSARIIVKDDNSPKYVNSPETLIFKKGELLYALAQAKSGIRQANYAILCEGQLDVIAMHRAGLNMAVAPQGLAFTVEQAELLKRYTNTLLLCFDSDKAGRAGTARVLDFLLPLGMEVKALNIAGGKDPDELFKTGGKEALQALLAAPRTLTQILLEEARSKFDLSNAYGKAQAAENAVKRIAAIPDLLQRELYLRELAGALLIDPDTLFLQLKAERRKNRKAPSYPGAPAPAANTDPAAAEAAKPQPPPDLRPLQVRHAEASLLALALQDAEAAQKLGDTLDDALLSEAPAARLLRKVLALALNGSWCSGAALLEKLEPELAQDPECAKMLIADLPIAENQREKLTSECIETLQKEQAKTVRAALYEELRGTTDLERQRAILEELRNLPL